MYPAGKAADSRNIDRIAIENGIPSLILMENAAFSLYLETVKIIESFKPEKIVLFAGKGGNGGDGFALLRILRDRGCSIPMNIVKFFELNELKGDSLQNWKMLPSDISSTEMKKIKGRTLFIDGMVGTGLKNNLTGKIREAVSFINSYKDKYVLSIDVPTGLDSDKGIEMPEAVIADTTVTMGIYKTGLFAQNGPAACGKIVLGKISAVDAGTSDTKYAVVEDLIPEPLKIPVDSYKNRNGHCLVIGGDIDKLGASLIAARSFMASGGGLVTAAFEKSLHKKIAGLVPGMMLTDIETAEHQLDRYSSIITGPGLTSWPFKESTLLKRFKGIIIADAGMFDLMNEKPEILSSLKKCKTVFTPHPGELKRFISAKNDEPWIDCVERFPLEKTHVLVAKSHSTFIRNTESTVIVPHGAKALSFGGSGDALTGLLAFETFYNGFEKGCLRAVLRHRLAGIELEKRYSASYHSIEKLVELIGIAGTVYEK